MFLSCQILYLKGIWKILNKILKGKWKYWKYTSKVRIAWIFLFLLFQKFWAYSLCLKAEAFFFFLFEAKVEKVDKEDFEDDIIMKKFGWTYDNLLEIWKSPDE